MLDFDRLCPHAGAARHQSESESVGLRAHARAIATMHSHCSEGFGLHEMPLNCGRCTIVSRVTYGRVGSFGGASSCAAEISRGAGMVGLVMLGTCHQMAN
jgi:hypothetical protein